jgi:hypothetical protein
MPQAKDWVTLLTNQLDKALEHAMKGHWASAQSYLTAAKGTLEKCEKRGESPLIPSRNLRRETD